MWFNNIKTALLLGMLSSLFMLIGALFGGNTGIYIALIIAAAINIGLFFFSDRLALSMYRAQPLDHDQYHFVYAMVHELSSRMRIPMPKLWLIHAPMANAFATGRSPKHASIALTGQLFSLLDQHELRSVLAHELSHIKNRDILVTTVAATIATAIGYLANMLHHAAFWSSMTGSGRQKKNNPFVMIIVAILMPLAATLLQLALSRSREYLADETGAHACGDPRALAGALQKLHYGTNNEANSANRQTDAVSGTMASLFIVNPFLGKDVLYLFATHPPVKERVARLQILFERMKGVA